MDVVIVLCLEVGTDAEVLEDTLAVGQLLCEATGGSKHGETAI